MTSRQPHPLACLLRERNLPVHRLAAALEKTERLVYYWLANERLPTNADIVRMSEVFHLPPSHIRSMFFDPPTTL